MRPQREAVVWAPVRDGTPLPVSVRLAPGDSATQSLLQFDCPESRARAERFDALVARVVRRLRRQGIEIAPAPSPTTQPTRAALLVIPSGAPYSILLPTVRTALEQCGYRVEHLAPEAETRVTTLHEALASVDVVLGEWGTLLGRVALYQTWVRGRPAVALSRRPTIAQWPGRLVSYAQRRDIFLRSLRAALREVDAPSPELAGPAPPSPSSTDPTAERQRIYREVALDKRAPLEQRYHAARVLSESGDPQGAAPVLGAIVMHPEAGTLAEEALGILGTLGAVALPVLWRLDVLAPTPHRAVEIARQLARAGDTQTALFRLERLAGHGQEMVRLQALDAMADAGQAATEQFETLARQARDPRVRLQAARWLLEQREADDVVRQTLVELASRTRHADIAHLAVELLARMEDDDARQALRRIAHESRNPEARLAAAEIMTQVGDTTAARAVLLSLAQSADDSTAPAALDMLVHLSDQPTEDTERLMNTAALRSIRRRAAESLSRPHQPEPVQLAAARVFMALERPGLARPVLLRLAQSGATTETQRWAAQQLALIGESALDEIRRALELLQDPVAGQYLAEALLARSRLPQDRRKAAVWLAEHSNLPRGVEVLGDLALSARVSGG
ncbi:MAG: HEAT repeat domain-containing protein, partial [Ardenticatenaceae bacterium]